VTETQQGREEGRIKHLSDSDPIATAWYAQAAIYLVEVEVSYGAVCLLHRARVRKTTCRCIGGEVIPAEGNEPVPWSRVDRYAFAYRSGPVRIERFAHEPKWPGIIRACRHV
jgi:hypothetical protein